MKPAGADKVDETPIGRQRPPLMVAIAVVGQQQRIAAVNWIQHHATEEELCVWLDSGEVPKTLAKAMGAV